MTRSKEINVIAELDKVKALSNTKTLGPMVLLYGSNKTSKGSLKLLVGMPSDDIESVVNVLLELVASVTSDGDKAMVQHKLEMMSAILQQPEQRSQH